jgi:hypothetical protein
MAKKTGVTLGENHLASKERGTKFANSGGFDRDDSKLGKDTIPGPAVGAPLMQTRVVDDFDAKRTRYPDGIYPGSFNDKASAQPSTPTMQENINPQSRAATKNSAVPLGTQHPDIAVIDKATEVGRAQAEIGDEPSGVLKR